jgi:hypothetical protein
MNQELANAVVASATTGAAGVTLATGDNTAYVFFKKLESATPITGLNAESVFASGKWGDDGSKYVDGYVNLYYGPASGTQLNAADLEQNVLAV